MQVCMAQGRSPDDECHRARRGRENFWRKFIVTKSLELLIFMMLAELVRVLSVKYSIVFIFF
jgi:hypothetical protein